jgi:hypothetical protein
MQNTLKSLSKVIALSLVLVSLVSISSNSQSPSVHANSESGSYQVAITANEVINAFGCVALFSVVASGAVLTAGAGILLISAAPVTLGTSGVVGIGIFSAGVMIASYSYNSLCGRNASLPHDDQSIALGEINETTDASLVAFASYNSETIVENNNLFASMSNEATTGENNISLDISVNQDQTTSKDWWNVELFNGFTV